MSRWLSHNVAEKVFIPREVEDFLSDYIAGMNSGVSPLLLKHNQGAFLLNSTVRGAFARNRPPYQHFTLTFVDEPTRLAFEGGLFQGYCFYNPDAGDDAIMVAISGKLYKITPSLTTFTATVVEVSTASTQQSPIATKHWLWQSEKWVIWNDGSSLPVFYDGTTTVRSGGQTPPAPPTFPNISQQVWTVPQVGSSVALTTSGDYSALNGQYVTVITQGIFLTSLGGPATVTLTSINPVFPGSIATAGTGGWPVSQYGTSTFRPELPAGRMGVYGMGRNWMALTDGKQFVASDLVGGSSGTQANNYRDAVLKVTENAFLSGGGYFTVPGSVGDIKAMKFASTLDVSLGQGPLQVFTTNSVFSCNAPVDRATWQSLVNPILTQSLIGSGATSQEATIPVNNDIIFRSSGITVRSLILARREFSTWGNVPISDEMERVLLQDDTTLLQYASAVTFNNRLFMTASPEESDQGVFHPGTIVINFDPLSSMRGKLPSVWDGLWTGLNVLGYVADTFNDVERCFALTLNVTEGKIELYEVLQDDAQIADDGSIPILWGFESGSRKFGQDDPRNRDLLKLIDGEIFIDQLEGRVDFRMYYKPDQYPCWVLWRQWSECASLTSTQPQFRPRMGLGEPSGVPCDASTGRPFREGYNFQFKLLVNGRCRFLGARFKAVTLPQSRYAPPGCPCPTEESPATPQYLLEDGYLSLLNPIDEYSFLTISGNPAVMSLEAEGTSRARVQDGYLQLQNPFDSVWHAVISINDPPQFSFVVAASLAPANPARVKRDGTRLWLFNDTTGLYHRVYISSAGVLSLVFAGER